VVGKSAVVNYIGTTVDEVRGSVSKRDGFAIGIALINVGNVLYLSALKRGERQPSQTSFAIILMPPNLLAATLRKLTRIISCRHYRADTSASSIPFS